MREYSSISRGLKNKENIDGVEVYNLLKNPLRREILTLLYTRGEMSATQLKLLLSISYGTLYYHLEFLKPLINQVRRGRYVLNEKGLLVVEKMMRDVGAEPKPKHPTAITRFLSVAPLMERIAFNPLRYSALSIPIIAAYLILTYLMPIKTVILHISFNPSGGNILNSIISMGIVLGYVLLSGEILSPYSGGFGGLIISTIISYIPIDLYLLLLLLFQYFNIQISSIVLLLQSIFVVTHIIQLIMIASGLTHSRGIGWEKSLPSSLLLSYISMLTIYYNLM
ncbi:MAG: helix-turn-helix domain-containing protein [Aigarchaeota archaeon]|nr:helix-turn-helix domain-containing protein [Aigarchaeota archaeon]MCX8192344.1 helix-turn-helix domain-containing protein [Nitrososphaeria archaeon]MDW7986868.1 helix-turn-helix domain-containing protein [Nitrososphaerota archaeon]